MLKNANKIDVNRYELNISVDAETFAKALDVAFKKNAKKLNVPGFRKGKAPKGIIQSMYGEDVFYDEALNEVYPDEMENAQREAGIEVVDFQDIEFDLKSIGKDGVEFTVKVTVKPEAEVKDYKGIKVEKTQIAVTAEDIDADIEQMRMRVSTMETVTDRAAQMDDIVTFDFDGYVDGEQFEGGKADSYSLKLGSNQFIPGFEEQIVGKNVEEDFDVNVTFPEDYHAENLKGKEAVFKCKIHEIKNRVLPELDDEFAKDVSEFDSLDELKADVEKKLTEQREKQAQNEVENKILDVVIENTDVTIPQAMIETKIDDNIRDFSYSMQMQGL
ncbi:MAG: trigger factor, partial [Acutalibacteraceae bacterium]|nr:trigger factor [Acutalibacteraceae bacterium]